MMMMMMMTMLKWCCFLVICCFLVTVSGDSNKERTFRTLKAPIPCVRRFNATHQIGCGKRDIGNYDGIVYAVRTQLEFNRLLSFDNGLNGARKLILLTMPQFYESVINLYLAKPKLINGIVLLASLEDSSTNYSRPEHYSADSKAPNSIFSLYGGSNQANIEQVKWNENAGTSFMFRSYDIPIYVLTSEEDVKLPIDECYEKFNKKVFERADSSSRIQEDSRFEIYSTDLLCGMRLGLEMSGAVSSKVCIRRSNIIHTLSDNVFCDPIGGVNYFTFLSQKPSNDLPITIISSRIDAFTMFEYYTPAANEPISSLIGFLSLAELFTTYRLDFTSSNLLFVLFDNEAFDYGGSSKFASELRKNEFPSLYVNTSAGPKVYQLSKDNITSMIELSQLGSIGLSSSTNNLLFIHRDPISYGSNKTISNLIDAFESSLKKFSNGSISPVNNINQALPPSSLQMFLRENITLAGIVISDHERMYKSNYYHSVFDTPEALNIVYPTNITEKEAETFTTQFASRLKLLITNLAQSIYNLNTNKQLPSEASQLTINRLAYCYYKNVTCSFFRSILTDSQWTSYLSLLQSTLPVNRLSFYTGVDGNTISGKWITFMMFRYLTRNSLVDDFNATECNKDSQRAQRLINETNVTIRAFVFVENHDDVKSLCIGSAIYGTSSVSPAFDQADDTGSLVDTDKYSAWTESSWSGKSDQMQLFMFTCDAIKYVTISMGCGICVLSFLLVYMINKNSNKFLTFNHPEQAAEFIEQT